MPNMDGVQATLLVEDEALERFVRGVLLALGFHRRKIRVNRSPEGKGSGKRYVEQTFPAEVRALRRKANHLNIALVVGTDADELTVIQRACQLDLALEAARLDQRGPTERICLLIPKWHVETWIRRLNDHQIDENKEYKNDVRVQDVDFPMIAQDFVKHFRDWKQSEPIPELPPAVIAALEELKRLDL